MRLINFGVGEITDRLTILSLKILHNRDGDVSHFTNERSALLAKLAGRNLNGSWYEHSVELGAVNAAIWHNEDELRGWRARGITQIPHINDRNVVEIAFKLQELNDRRHELIAEINKKAGDFFGREKDHGPAVADQPDLHLAETK